MATRHRDVCLIPTSAHGTNPASAQMVGMKVVVVKVRENGDIDLDDFRAKAEQHAAQPLLLHDHLSRRRTASSRRRSGRSAISSISTAARSISTAPT